MVTCGGLADATRCDAGKATGGPGSSRWSAGGRNRKTHPRHRGWILELKTLTRRG